MLEYLPSFEREILARLRLNASDAARLCGITPRQLRYWAEKGFVPTAPGSPNHYDVCSLEKAILIRRTMDDGYKLATSSQTVDTLLTDEAEQRENLEELDDDEMRRVMLDYPEQLEQLIVTLRDELPTYLTLSRLGEAARPPDAKSIEQFFRENHSSFDTAPNLALRLGRAAAEVEVLLEQLTRSGLLVKSHGDTPVYRLRREDDRDGLMVDGGWLRRPPPPSTPNLNPKDHRWKESGPVSPT